MLSKKEKKKDAFTLIELLVVVAIIAIIALIAIPNFLEAQTRSKVARASSDFRTFATGLEAYCVDCNRYPLNMYGGWTPHLTNLVLTVLTTPVSYLTDVSRYLDPFRISTLHNPNSSYLYFNLDYFSPPHYSWLAEAHGEQFARRHGKRAWALVSWGPDQKQDYAEHLTHYPYCPHNLGTLYDPTNGTVSSGDILRVGGATKIP